MNGQRIPFLEVSIRLITANKGNVRPSFDFDFSIDNHGRHYPDSITVYQGYVLGSRMDDQLASSTLASLQLVHDLMAKRTVA